MFQNYLTLPCHVRRAWTIWATLGIVVLGLILGGNRRTVTPEYREAAHHWMAGESLYDGTGTGFLYLPQAAIVYVPFAALPFTLSEVLWRVVTIASFAAALWQLARLAQGERSLTLFPTMTLVVVPLAFSSARNGQMTLPMAALMIFAVAALAEQRWRRAAACLAVAVALKPLAMVLVLLAAALYRPLRVPMAVGLLAVVALPWLAQSPSYATSQYAACLGMFRDAVDFGIQSPYAQLFGMLGVTGIEVPRAGQTAIRLIAAGATLGLCLWAKRRQSAPQFAVTLYTLAACYLMLMNPRTENNTYSLFAPALAAMLAQSLLQQARLRRAIVLAVLALGTVGSFEFGRLLTARHESIWLAPLMCLVFLGLFVRELLAEGAATAGHPAADRAGDQTWRPRAA